MKPFELDPTSFSTPTEDEQDHSTRFLAVSEMSRITSGLVDDSGHVVTRAWDDDDDDDDDHDDDDDMMIMSFFFRSFFCSRLGGHVFNSELEELRDLFLLLAERERTPQFQISTVYLE